MEILGIVLLFVVSLAILVKSSDWFIEGAENIGLGFRISPFIIGVTVVAFGTSLPELAASIAAVLNDSSEIVVGNVVGSNITNILLVISLTVMLGREINLKRNILDTDMPLLVGSALFLLFVLWDARLDKVEAILLLVGLIIFLLSSVGGSKLEGVERTKVHYSSYVKLIGGGILVWLSADYTIQAIQNISEIAGINQDIIGLSLVALGTSLPEVFVSITAAKRGNTEIAVGNVIGSNIFNTYAVMGIPGLIGNLEIRPEIVSFHLPFMVAVTLVFLLVIMSKRINQGRGIYAISLLCFFLLYIIKGGYLTYILNFKRNKSIYYVWKYVRRSGSQTKRNARKIS